MPTRTPPSRPVGPSFRNRPPPLPRPRRAPILPRGVRSAGVERPGPIASSAPSSLWPGGPPVRDWPAPGGPRRLPHPSVTCTLAPPPGSSGTFPQPTLSLIWVIPARLASRISAVGGSRPARHGGPFAADGEGLVPVRSHCSAGLGGYVACCVLTRLARQTAGHRPARVGSTATAAMTSTTRRAGRGVVEGYSGRGSHRNRRMATRAPAAPQASSTRRWPALTLACGANACVRAWLKGRSGRTLAMPLSGPEWMGK